jgi:8-oxo-dGTP pyrophosphatase MutT (NUDIX family)
MGTKTKGAKRSAAIERRREVSAGGLVWRRDRAGRIKVVLVKPAGKNAWAIPKGHLEDGETTPEAAIREVREETGLTVADARPLGDISYVYSMRAKPEAPLVRIFKRVHFYLMRVKGGDTSAHDGEIDQVVWVPLDEAARLASYESERALIEKARSILTAERA